MFTVRNTVIVAVMQVGVIVAGVLASGLIRRFFGDMPMPWMTILFYDYGVFLFLIPLTWAMCALLAHRREDISDDTKDVWFALGIVVLLTLVESVFAADVIPFFRGMNLGGAA
jgi:hypothetical protein